MVRRAGKDDGSIPNRQLQPRDIVLLKATAVLGEFVPVTVEHEHRLQRLEREGYIMSVHRDPATLDVPPPSVYRLTPKGMTIVSKR